MRSVGLWHSPSGCCVCCCGRRSEASDTRALVTVGHGRFFSNGLDLAVRWPRTPP